MTPAEIAARRALLEETEKFAATLRAELAAEGVETDEVSIGDMLTVKVAADYYGVSLRTARRWAHKWGKPIGGRLFVSRAAIEGRRP